MTDRQASIFLLAGDADVERRVLEAVPEARPSSTALEALADMAAADGPATLIARPTALGYRQEQILAALGRQLPEARVHLIATPEEEPLAMRLAGDGNYFLVPFGLRDLARALAPAEPPPVEQTADHRMSRSGQQTLQSDQRKDVGSVDPTYVSPGQFDAHRVDPWRAGLQQIACMSGQPPAAIARTAVETLVTVAGVAAAAVLTDGGATAPLAASGNQADWSAAIEALGDPTLTANQWVPLDDHLWIFAAAGAQENGPALAVRGAEPGLSVAVLEDLATAARVALSLVAAARVREAAIRIISTDAETGLASRRYLDHYLALAVRRAGESRREITLALISPSGNSLLSRSSLQALGEMLKQDFPTGRAPSEGAAAVKLARSDADTLAVVFVGSAEGRPSPQERLASFAQRVAEASLPAPTAMASASFPWQAADATALMAAAAERLAKSRTSGLPIIE